MTDSQLQERAGLNVGNQPSFLTFIQKAGNRTTVIPTSGTPTVILEGIEDGFRSKFVSSVDGVGQIFNGSAQAYDWSLLFQDDEGNQMEIGSGSVGALGSVTPGVPGQNALNDSLDESMFALAPGEKFLLAITPTVPP